MPSRDVSRGSREGEEEEEEGGGEGGEEDEEDRRDRGVAEEEVELGPLVLEL